MAEMVTHWTRFEGGDWMSCEAWKIPPQNVLDILVAQVPQSTMRGCKVVHGLKKEPLHSFKTSLNRRWDCLNGWTS